MKNKYTAYPEDNFAQHIAPVNTGKGFKCDEKYKFVPSNIFTKALSKVILAVALVVFTIYFRVFERVKIIDKKNYKEIKKNGGVIVFNHVHFMDIVMIDSLITRFPEIRVLTLEESFGIPVARWFMKLIGCVPIPTSFKAHKNFLKTVDDILNSKRVLAVAAEGYMWPYYPGLRPFHVGAFRFACKNNKGISPMVVLFEKKGKKNRVRPIVRVLEPIYPNMDLPIKECEADLSHRTFEAMKKALCEFYPDDTKYRNFNEK